MEQKVSSSSDFLRSRTPFVYASPTALAPAGYPPITAETSKDSAPMGIPISLPGNSNRWILSPKKESVITELKKRNGNREGITVFMQSSIPSAAAEHAVFPSRIRTSMTIKEQKTVICFRWFIVFTSVRFMQGQRDRFIYF